MPVNPIRGSFPDSEQEILCAFTEIPVRGPAREGHITMGGVGEWGGGMVSFLLSFPTGYLGPQLKK